MIVIPRARLDEAVAVLAAAFARDLLLTYVFAGLGERFPVALRALFRFACAVRFELDWPLLGVERWERYPALADRHRPAAPNYGVGVIGVHPDYQGQGIGGRLLDAVHARSLAHPTSTGVYLDTENPASKRFYERCGYRTIAHERLDGAVDIWCLFRPNDARP